MKKDFNIYEFNFVQVLDANTKTKEAQVAELASSDDQVFKVVCDKLEDDRKAFLKHLDEQANTVEESTRKKANHKQSIRTKVRLPRLC